MQAALYRILSSAMQDARVIVEPGWDENNALRYRPDIVIVQGDTITDIFELKFVPHHFPRFKEDIHKLKTYLDGSRSADMTYYCNLDSQTGRWCKRKPQPCPNQESDLHFVVIAQHDAAAVWGASIIRELKNFDAPASLHHRYGRIGCPSMHPNTVEQDCHPWAIQFNFWAKESFEASGDKCTCISRKAEPSVICAVRDSRV